MLEIEVRRQKYNIIGLAKTLTASCCLEAITTMFAAGCSTSSSLMMAAASDVMLIHEKQKSEWPIKCEKQVVINTLFATNNVQYTAQSDPANHNHNTMAQNAKFPFGFFICIIPLTSISLNDWSPSCCGHLVQGRYEQLLKALHRRGCSGWLPDARLRKRLFHEK